jgi:ABC-type lipoprotein release transport system permease subunit
VFWRYVWGELKLRKARTATMALGLAVGVSLVIGIVGVSEGLKTAQDQALSPLGSVGTSLIVTRTVAPTTSTKSTTSSSSQPGFQGGNGGGFFARGVAGFKDNSQVTTLLANNESVLTDLAKLGPPGSSFNHDFFVPGTLITFPQVAVSDVARTKGVANAVGALYLQGLHETGTVPKIVASFKTGGQTINTTVTPPPISPAQRAAERACILNLLSQSGASGAGGPGGAGGQGGGFRALASNPAFDKCLTPAQISYQQQVVVPEQTISEVLNPPSTNISTSSFTVAGIDPQAKTDNLVTPSQLVSGSWFSKNSTDEVLVDESYAASHQIKVGQTMSINGQNFKVEGLVSPTIAGNVADLYFPLSKLQSMASAPGYVNEILVDATKSQIVPSVVSKLHKELPGATLLTSKSLAEQVSGSLAAASTLASDVGTIAALVVLIAAFAIAVVLTISNVSKRVREIGSLRAMGWSRGLVVREILAEAILIALAGGIVGVLLGLGASAWVSAAAPSLSVSASSLAVGASSLGSIVHQASAGIINSKVRLSVPVHLTTVLLGLAAALVGGVIAGIIGGSRAAGLAPAQALRDVN